MPNTGRTPTWAICIAALALLAVYYTVMLIVAHAITRNIGLLPAVMGPVLYWGLPLALNIGLCWALAYRRGSPERTYVETWFLVIFCAILPLIGPLILIYLSCVLLNDCI